MLRGHFQIRPLITFQINDPYVLRALVNTASIERTFLFETRAEASDVLNTMRGGGIAFTNDGFSVRNYGYVVDNIQNDGRLPSFSDGGEQSQPLGRPRQEYNLLFRQGNAEDQVQ
jgi:hypothetical protein